VAEKNSLNSGSRLDYPIPDATSSDRPIASDRPLPLGNDRSTRKTDLIRGWTQTV